MKPAKEQYQHLQYAHFLAQTMGDKSLSFDLWTANLKLASYIGDTAFLYNVPEAKPCKP